MAKYHKYVFDTDKRKFIGDFETMYKNEAKEGFDSWHQEDSRQFHRRVIKLLLEDYNFSKIVDFGCGKGSFTHTLKKKNNVVIGVDISSTATKIAVEKFPDLKFVTADINNTDNLTRFFKKHKNVDLVVLTEVLSYCSNWKKLLEVYSKYTVYVVVSLYIPPNPIGYVKTREILTKELNRYFNQLELIELNTSEFTVYFGKRK